MRQVNTEWKTNSFMEDGRTSNEEWLHDLEVECSAGPPLDQEADDFTDKQRKARVDTILKKMEPYVS